MSNKPQYPTQLQIEKLQQYILKEKNKDTEKLEKMGLEWTKTAWENKLSYESTWLGMPIIQTPEDTIVLQQVIYDTRPDYIIETGIAHGGSLIFYASLCELLGTGKVIGIDIDIRSHNKVLIENHPMYKHITMIQGSSTDPIIVNKVKSLVKPGSKVMVVLDSNHTTEHVYNELIAYSPMVTVGNYLVVCDTIMPYLVGLKHASPEYATDSAMAGMKKFLTENDNFVSDPDGNKFYASNHPEGYLKRVK